MIELSVLAVVAVVALLGLGLVLLALTAVAFVIRLFFWVIFLPFRLLFGLLLLPLLLIKTIVGGLFSIVLGPLFAFVAIVTAIVIAALFALPLAPVLLLLFVCWMFARARRPALPASTAGAGPPLLGS
jgi:hypothetical protein